MYNTWLGIISINELRLEFWQYRNIKARRRMVTLYSSTCIQYIIIHAQYTYMYSTYAYTHMYMYVRTYIRVHSTCTVYIIIRNVHCAVWWIHALWAWGCAVVRRDIAKRGKIMRLNRSGVTVSAIRRPHLWAFQHAVIMVSVFRRARISGWQNRTFPRPLASCLWSY